MRQYPNATTRQTTRKDRISKLVFKTEIGDIQSKTNMYIIIRLKVKYADPKKTPNL